MAAVFNAQSRLERWTDRRRLWGRAIIVASVPMAMLLNAGMVGGVLVKIVLSSWLLCLLCCCASAEAVSRAQAQLDRLVASAKTRARDPLHRPVEPTR